MANSLRYCGYRSAASLAAGVPNIKNIRLDQGRVYSEFRVHISEIGSISVDKKKPSNYCSIGYCVHIACKGDAKCITSDENGKHSAESEADVFCATVDQESDVRRMSRALKVYTKQSGCEI